MKKTIKTVKGTREFYPETMSLRNYLYDKVRNASQLVFGVRLRLLLRYSLSGAFYVLASGLLLTKGCIS